MTMSSLYETLPDLIDSVSGNHFYKQVENCFNRLSPLAGFKIFSYPKLERPQLLGTDTYSEMDHLYCESAYLMDPFYHVICCRTQQELVTLDSIIRDDFESSSYYDKFYNRIGWSNEANFIVSVSQERTIAVAYTSDEIPLHHLNRELTPFLKSIRSAIRLHEKWVANYADDPDLENRTRDVIELTTEKFNGHPTRSLDAFDLTRREREIVNYILSGHPTPEIANLCFVSEGTVKNHRKNIYRKLGVKSQVELFSKFLN